MKITDEEVAELNAKRTEHQGHSWVHDIFKKGKQLGSHTCFGKDGERVFTINERENSNAENDYQFYASAPEMANLVASQAEELDILKSAIIRITTGFNVILASARHALLSCEIAAAENDIANGKQALNHNSTKQGS